MHEKNVNKNNVLLNSGVTSKQAASQEDIFGVSRSFESPWNLGSKMMRLSNRKDDKPQTTEESQSRDLKIGNGPNKVTVVNGGAFGSSRASSNPRPKPSQRVIKGVGSSRGGFSSSII